VTDEDFGAPGAKPPPSQPPPRTATPEPDPPTAQGSVPPQNLEAEESVLGAMLISEAAISACEEVLGEDGSPFYRESHAVVYRACLALSQQGEPVDAITTVDLLEKQGELERVGGRARIHELAALVPATANAAHYARIVREMATLRGLLRAGAEISRLGKERPGETADLVDRAEQAIFDVSVGRDRTDLLVAKDAIGPAFTHLEELERSGRSVVGLPTGLKDLDALTSGLHPGNLVVVAARPSMGKSALALCIAANVTVHSELPAVLFTLEMSQREVMQRLMCVVGMVDSQKVRNGRGLDSEDWRRLTNASSKIAGAPLFMDDASLLTVGEIRAKARRLKMRQKDLSLIVVDYLQLMAAGDSRGERSENRVQEISKISRALKVLAGELEVPVLALSQLSRAVEQRHDKRPILSDLRESGSIEQDADVVMMLYRDEYYNPEDTDQQGIAEVNVAKQRNGPTNTVKVAFVKRYTRFDDLAPPGLPGHG
jgi:replicative DNA helicase